MHENSLIAISKKMESLTIHHKRQCSIKAFLNNYEKLEYSFLELKYVSLYV